MVAKQHFKMFLLYMQACLGFPDEVASGPSNMVATSYRVLDYYKATNRPLTFDFLGVQNALSELGTLATWKSDVDRLQGDFAFLQAHSEQFDHVDPAFVEGSIKILQDDVTNINAAASSIINDPLTNHTLPEVKYKNIAALPTWTGLVPIIIKLGIFNRGSWRETTYEGSDWAGTQGSDTWDEFYGVGISAKAPVEGLNIRYEISDGLREQTVSGHDGDFVSLLINGRPITAGKFRVWLDGPMAGLYKVWYKGWLSFSEPSPTSANGAPCEGIPGSTVCLNCSEDAARDRARGHYFGAIRVDIRGANDPPPF